MGQVIDFQPHLLRHRKAQAAVAVGEIAQQLNQPGAVIKLKECVSAWLIINHRRAA